jgi:membrane associated rhomboid family serine protease
MNFFSVIKNSFIRGNALVRLIFVNVAVFAVVSLLAIVLKLFNSESDFIDSALALPSSLSALLYHPWTALTYMFLHEDILHILFNMIALYWFGKLFLICFSEKQLVALYLIGGFAGALLMVAAYNIFPYFSDKVALATLRGASASIMAITVAVAVQAPNMSLRFLLFGNIKLKYIAIVMVAISFFGVTGGNAGGEFSHLGGALAGLVFVLSLRGGRDITKGLNCLLDRFFSLFGRPKLKATKPRWQQAKMSDAEFNANKARQAEEIDRILDKIKASGYESLTSEEKRRLFEQGNK